MNVTNNLDGIVDKSIFQQIYEQIYNKKGTLKKLIGKYYIEQEKAESLEEIKLNTVKIRDFSFLNFFLNVNSIVFEKCDFSDFSSQGEVFSNVQSIEIEGKDTPTLENINFLSAFPNMIDICISRYEEIGDISELKYHKSLAEINLLNILKVDTSVLKECKNIELVYFDNYMDKPISKVNYTNKGSIDLSFLNCLPKLDTLTLGGQNLTDITFLSKFQNLKMLELPQGSDFKNIESLQNLKNLTVLEIEDEKMSEQQVAEYKKMFSYIDILNIDNSEL